MFLKRSPVGEGGARWASGARWTFLLFNIWWTIPRLALQFWRQISTSCRLQECNYCKLSPTNDTLIWKKKYASWSNFTVSWKCRLSKMHTYNCSVIGCLNWTTVEVLKVTWIPCLIVYPKEGAVRFLILIFGARWISQMGAKWNTSPSRPKGSISPRTYIHAKTWLNVYAFKSALLYCVHILSPRCKCRVCVICASVCAGLFAATIDFNHAYSVI